MVPTDRVGGSPFSDFVLGNRGDVVCRSNFRWERQRQWGSTIFPAPLENDGILLLASPNNRLPSRGHRTVEEFRALLTAAQRKRATDTDGRPSPPRTDMDSPGRPGDQAGATFRTDRILPFPPQQVFDAFARPELLARWWGPNGFTNSFEIFEFKPGGRWKFVMHGPDGTNYPNENVFLELIAPSLVVIQHVSSPHFVLRVSLASHASGTAIDWLQEFEDSAVAARVRSIVEPSNEQNLDRLTAVLSGG